VAGKNGKQVADEPNLPSEMSVPSPQYLEIQPPSIPNRTTTPVKIAIRLINT
jgi:hypothetical protein